jgi:Flp pilus assembly protein TadG
LVLVLFAAMVAFVSLAVDFGRVQLSKTELQAVADAAARYAAMGLQNDIQGQSAAASNARAVIAQNKVDGKEIDFRASEDLQIGVWDSNTRTFTPNNDLYVANAVKVTLRKTAARNDAIPLLFASILGRNTQDVTADAVAVVDFSAFSGGAGNGRFEYYIPATSNPWLSGMPDGTVANNPNPHNNPDYAGSEYVDDGTRKSVNRGTNGSGSSNGNGSSNWNNWGNYAPKKGSPIKAGTIPIVPGTTISFDGINGGANNFNSSTLYTGDGNLGWIVSNLKGNENGIADLKAPINSVVAVFLNDQRPDQAGSIPSRLDFSTPDSRDFTVLSPQLRQPFFIGDGRRANGEVQQFVVPAGATRLYIGTMDGWEWNNNVGGFEVAATIKGTIRLVD